MLPGGVLADVVNCQLHQAVFARPLDDGDVQRANERRGEEGEHIEAHQERPGSCSTGPASSSESRLSHAIAKLAK